MQLMHSLVTSIILYACESWNLTAEVQRRIRAMEMRCYRKILRISYKAHVTSEEVCDKIQQAIEVYEDLLTIVKRCKVKWHGYVSHSSALPNTILQGTVNGRRRQGRQKKRWEDIIKDSTMPGVCQVPEGSGEQRRMEETGYEVIFGAPVTPAVKG